MHLAVIFRVTGTLLTFFSFTFLIPALLALAYNEPMASTFMIAFGITLSVGLTLWLPLRGNRELRGGDGFLITALFYLGLGLFGAIPLFMSSSTELSFTDAAFESMSGLTTTGATVITGLDELPRSLLFYRQRRHKSWHRVSEPWHKTGQKRNECMAGTFSIGTLLATGQ